MKTLITSILISAALCTLTACQQVKVGSECYVSKLRKKVVYDCAMKWDESVAEAPEDCGPEIVNNLALVEVFYYSFDGKVHRGQLLVDYRLAEDVQEVFKVILDERFPIYGAIPIDHSTYSWKDFNTLPQGNTYSFCYRNIVFKKRLSYHSFGQAVDINPVLNPFKKWGATFPPDGSYDPEHPGTLYDGHPVVVAFESRGWKWGGRWRRKDYQHFQKPINEELLAESEKNLKNPKVVDWPFRMDNITELPPTYYTIR